MSGVISQELRQKLMAINPFPELQTVIDYCCSYESSVKDSSTLSQGNIAKVTNKWNNSSNSYNSESSFYCGKARYPRSECPAAQSKCNTCGKTGHWQTVCRKKLTRTKKLQQLITFIPQEFTTIQRGHPE